MNMVVRILKEAHSIYSSDIIKLHFGNIDSHKVAKDEKPHLTVERILHSLTSSWPFEG